MALVEAAAAAVKAAVTATANKGEEGNKCSRARAHSYFHRYKLVTGKRVDIFVGRTQVRLHACVAAHLN